MFGNLFKFGQKKLEQAGEDLSVAIMNLDLDTAEEVELERLTDALKEQALEETKAEEEYRREQAEYIAKQKLSDEKMAVAEQLQEQMAALAAEGGDVSQHEEALGIVLTELEELEPEIAVEKEEADMAREVYEALKQRSAEQAEMLANFKKQWAKMRAAKKRADINEERALRQQQQAEKLAGLRKTQDSASKLMDKINEKVSESETRAAAAKRHAELVKPKTSSTNPLIAEAAKSVSGTGSTSSGSVSDRLAALKAKK